MDFCPTRCRAIQRADRRDLPPNWLILLFSVVALVGVSRSAFAQAIQFPVNPAPTPEIENPYGVYLPTDRTLSRGMSRARERLNDGEYNEALAFLQQILDRDEDAFVDDALDVDTRRGLKAAARDLIAKLPKAGREMYQLLHAPAARRQLEAALAAGDRNALARIVRRYFLTPPGYEAAIVLAQMEFDRGHPLAAAHLYDELLNDAAASAQFEPQLSLLAAVSWSAAGEPKRAAATIRALAKDNPDAKLELAGKQVALPRANASDEHLLTWLYKSVGQPKSSDPTSADWLTQRGDPRRNSTRRGGAPHLSARWQSRVVNDPRFETFLTSRQQQAEQQGIATIAAARPIATGNVVLMRTPQNVVALDWQTGKRIWETREEESSARDRYLAEFMSGNNADEFSAMSHPLEQRVWDDTLTMSLSSDGQRVFALSGMALAPREQQSAWGVGPAFGGQFDNSASPTNRLTAYELPTEGKLAWEIDGANATGELAGAFFLGPPLAVDGSLFVLAEIRGAVYMLALGPATGKLEWRQQLVGLEQGITQDPQRRLNSAMPSYEAGVLVCPTTAGMVVAIDAIRREFAWVYRYPRQVDSFINVRQGWQGRVEVSTKRDNNRWLDGLAVIADGKVLLSPPESAELHCLELESGNLVWKKPRDKWLYVAGVDQGKVLLVGASSVAALHLADGSPAWEKERVELPAGVMPSGLGYLSEGRYYLPLSSGQVIAVNMQDGEVNGAIDTRQEATVGNLICHRGSVISQSSLFLDKFEQIEVLRERAKLALKTNPRDATAIRDLAEMRRLEGALAEAVPMLKQAYEIEPRDSLTRDMLADALLEALAADYAAYRAEIPLLREIIFRPQQHIELLRIDALGLDAAGQRMEALAAYLRLADAASATPTLLKIQPDHQARSDRWISARINALWAAASTAERANISRQLKERQSTWSDSPSVSQLRSYLEHFDGLPGSEGVRLQLVRELMERNEPLETEIEIIRLAHSPTKETQAVAEVLLIEWLIEQDRLEEANELAGIFARRWTDVTSIDGKTPEQWLDLWQSKLSAAESLVRSWPRGRVTADERSPAQTNRRERTRLAQAQYQLGLRRLRLEQIHGAPLGPSQWFIAHDNSLIVGRNALGKEVFRYRSARNSAIRNLAGNSDMVQAAQLGDLLLVTLGGQVLALDTSERADRDDAEVVWQEYPAGRYPLAIERSNRRGGRTAYHSWSQRKRLPGSAGLLVAGLGPVSPRGVVFREQQRLRCVDPTSGDTLWTREDVPPGSELFGDSEFVLAASVDEGEIYVIDMTDGELVERRQLPETPWLLTAGRNVAQLLETKVDERPRKSLRIVDAVSGKELFQADYDPAVRMTTLEPNAVAVVEPGGKFQLIDVRTGDTLIDQVLPIQSPPREIATLTSGDQLFLCVSGTPTQQTSRSIGPADYPLVNGQVYAFDLRDGHMTWPGPALVEQRGIALTQPGDVPILIFVDRLLKRDAGGAGAKLRLLCIDKTTGATIYRNDELPDTSGPNLRFQTSFEETPSFSIEMSMKTIRLTFTDEPRPPEPPTNELVEASRKSLGRGLWGVTRRVGNAIQDVIQDPEKNWPLHGIQPPAGDNLDEGDGD